MKKTLMITATLILLVTSSWAQQKQTLKDIGIEFDCSLQLKKISDNPATTYTPKMIIYDGLSANGKPYFSVSLSIEEYATSKTQKSIEEMIKVMLSPAMTTQQKNGITFYIDTQKSSPNADTYILQFVVKNKKYSFTISGKSGTKEEMEKVKNSISLLK